MSENSETTYLDCSWHSPEHVVRFYCEDDFDDREIYMTVHLDPKWRFFRRLWKAGYKCSYGHFDEFILGKEHGDKFIEMGKFLNGTETN